MAPPVRAHGCILSSWGPGSHKDRADACPAAAMVMLAITVTFEKTAMGHCYPESWTLPRSRKESLCKAKTGERAGEPYGDLAQEISAIQYLQ